MPSHPKNSSPAKNSDKGWSGVFDTRPQVTDDRDPLKARKKNEVSTIALREFLGCSHRKTTEAEAKFYEFRR